MSIASSRNSIQAYNLGLYTFLSSMILAGILIVRGTMIGESLLQSSRSIFTLRVVEVFASVALAFSGLALPRRPDVFYKGELVDRMYTNSAFSRFTYSWPTSILDLAAKKKDLDLKDLTRPDHLTRSDSVSAAWKKKNFKYPLWISLILAHKRALTIQLLLTLVTSVLNFAPQWVILQLLRLLERHEPGTSHGLDAWIWVGLLCLAIIVRSWVESYTIWLSYADLHIPVRAQLSALIFEKSMRRKDSKGAEKKKKDRFQEGGEDGSSEQQEEARAPVDEEEQLKKSKQSIVNLIGVDGKRIADFACYQYLFPDSLFKLIVSLAFLVSLLGWKALLAGFSAMIAIMPVNIYFSKRYANAQDRLMKLRDEKMEVVTEALQGIRQIKFSALEGEWEKKIGEVRERELSAVWSVFKNDTMLLACWITSPILLAALSLAVYAYLNSSLSPSVAFVSLGVFKALEMTLSIVPELTTDALDAWVSIKRIEQYLNSPEIIKISQDGEEVAFINASIAWPADEEIDEKDRFVLRNINVTFPKGELSVISGKTGTGKSLMLSAILGEADILEGTMQVPRAPPLLERHDDKANKSNWIIPNAIAYVAQIPWIENASIKDNILFGLPYDEERYHKTLEVCALTKDLEMLADGENTEIGANGINLSGGQKWRVTLARAIYSRAGILVLDDIFSAVDAHVGRHIFERCLNGELAEGRTRILVTHHVALCESKTKYLVELGNGGVLHAGTVAELRAKGILREINSHEEAALGSDKADVDDLATAVNSEGCSEGEGEQDGEGTNGDGLKKVPPKPTAPARKFVEEESREQGAIRKHIYVTYLKDSGGWLFWVLAVVFFTVVQCFTLGMFFHPLLMEPRQLTCSGRSWWLRIWTGDQETQEVHMHRAHSAAGVNGFTYTEGAHQTILHTASWPTFEVQRTLPFYLGVYIALAIISSVLSTLKYFYIYTGSIRASRKLFAKLNFTILRTPIRWLDTVPLGRILNRYTADFNIIDSQLANSLSFGAGSFLNLISVLVAGLIVSPYILVLGSALLLICLHYALRYLDAARPVKRLESTAKSPVFEQFGSALTGVATIRSFDKAQVYVERMYRKIDDYSTATWHLWLFNRWMGWRLSLVGSFFSSSLAALILMNPNIDSALAGFALAFAIDFTGAVMWTIRMYANVELNMNAAERIIEVRPLTRYILVDKDED